jgi:hypothetical protein
MFRGTGFGATMLTVPCTRGSMRKLRPVISATAFTTAWMSAFTKFSVIVSSVAAGGSWASGAAAATAKASAATVPRIVRASNCIFPPLRR